MMMELVVHKFWKRLRRHRGGSWRWRRRCDERDDLIISSFTLTFHSNFSLCQLAYYSVAPIGNQKVHSSDTNLVVLWIWCVGIGASPPTPFIRTWTLWGLALEWPPKVFVAYSRHFGYLFMGRLSCWIRLSDPIWMSCGSTYLDHISISYKFYKSNYLRNLFVVKHSHLHDSAALVGHVWREEIVAYKHTSYPSNMKAWLIVYWVIQL